MGKSSSKHKKTALLGQPTKAQIEELSKKFNINVQRINLLKQKYNMYCSSNAKLNVHSYLIIYREFINANATDVEIYKSFNGFDGDRDGYLDFIELLKAISLQTNNQARELQPKPQQQSQQQAILQPASLQPKAQNNLQKQQPQQQQATLQQKTQSLFQKQQPQSQQQQYIPPPPSLMIQSQAPPPRPPPPKLTSTMLKPIPPPPIPPPPAVRHYIQQQQPQQQQYYHQNSLQVYELPPIELPPVMQAIRPYRRKTQSIIGRPKESYSSSIYKRRVKLSNDPSRTPTKSYSYIGSRNFSNSFIDIPEVRKPYTKSESSYMVRQEPVHEFTSSHKTRKPYTKSESSFMVRHERIRERTPPPRSRRKVRKVTVYVPRTRSGSNSSSESAATAEFITKAVVHRSRSYQFDENNFSNDESLKADASKEEIGKRKPKIDNRLISPKDDEKRLEKEKVFFKPVSTYET